MDGARHQPHLCQGENSDKEWSGVAWHNGHSVARPARRVCWLALSRKTVIRSNGSHWPWKATVVGAEVRPQPGLRVVNGHHVEATVSDVETTIPHLPGIATVAVLRANGSAPSVRDELGVLASCQLSPRTQAVFCVRCRERTRPCCPTS